MALTFDDGFVNFAEVAWPLLRHHDLPVTLFVATERVGTNNAWTGADERGIPTLPLLDWDAIARMVDKGLTLGSHSRTHRHLTELSDAELKVELEGSADEIERRTGVRPTTFCYPYGSHDERVAKAALAVYPFACTTELRTLRASEDPSRLPRLDVHYYRTSKRLAAWGSGSFRRHLWLRSQARRLRQALR